MADSQLGRLAQSRLRRDTRAGSKIKDFGRLGTGLRALIIESFT